jgi:hypothetical protein
MTTTTIVCNGTTLVFTQTNPEDTAKIKAFVQTNVNNDKRGQDEYIYELIECLLQGPHLIRTECVE